MQGSVSPSVDGRCQIAAQEQLLAGRFWTIGEMARDYQVSLRTLRFYEDRGLLDPCRKGTSRLYSGHDRLQLQMILKGKQLGFTLAEIREILARDDAGGKLKLEPEQIISQIRHLEQQLSTLETALAELRLAQGSVPGNGHLSAA